MLSHIPGTWYSEIQMASDGVPPSPKISELYVWVLITAWRWLPCRLPPPPMHCKPSHPEYGFNLTTSTVPCRANARSELYSATVRQTAYLSFSKLPPQTNFNVCCWTMLRVCTLKYWCNRATAKPTMPPRPVVCLLKVQLLYD